MHLKRWGLLCAGAFAALLGASSLQAATILYAVTANDQILQINAGTGAVMSTVSLSTAGSGGSSSLGIGRSGSSYYIYDQNALGGLGALRQVDVTTGAVGSATSLGGYPTAEGDITFNGTTGYMVSNVPSNGDFDVSGPVYQFTTSASGSTILGLNNVDGASPSTLLAFDGLAYSSSDNSLYAITEDGKFLYRRNLSGWVPNAATSIAWTLVGATGLPNLYGCAGDSNTPCYSFGGFTYSPDDNKFYGVISRFSAPSVGSGDPAGVMQAAFFSINMLTGLASAPVDLGYLQVSGLTSAYSAPPPVVVPEPSTWALFAGGALALAAWRRRRS